MKRKNEIVISLERRHAENIVAGAKRVELRRRPVDLNAGDRIWLYVKIPVGAVVGCATVTGKLVDTPLSLWSQIGATSGLTRKEFFAYFADCDLACAILFEKIKTLGRPLLLEELREHPICFHPPQFYKKIIKGSALGAKLQSNLGLLRNPATK